MWASSYVYALCGVLNTELIMSITEFQSEGSDWNQSVIWLMNQFFRYYTRTKVLILLQSCIWFPKVMTKMTSRSCSRRLCTSPMLLSLRLRCLGTSVGKFNSSSWSKTDYSHLTIYRFNHKLNDELLSHQCRCSSGVWPNLVFKDLYLLEAGDDPLLKLDFFFLKLRDLAL